MGLNYQPPLVSDNRISLEHPQKTQRLKELKAEQQSFREALLGVFAAQEALRKSLSKTSTLVMCETTIWAWMKPSGREKNSCNCSAVARNLERFLDVFVGKDKKNVKFI